VDKRGANQEDAVVDGGAERSEERNVGNVVVAKVGLENIDNLCPENNIPCAELCPCGLGVDGEQEERAEGLVVVGGEVAEEQAKGQGPLGVDAVVNLEDDAEVLVDLALVLADEVGLPVKVKGKDIALLGGMLHRNHVEDGGNLLVGVHPMIMRNVEAKGM